MPGASEVKAGGAFIEIGGDVKPLKGALSLAARSIKSFASGIKMSLSAISSAAGTVVSSIKKIGGAALSAAKQIGQFASTQIRRGLLALSAGLGLAAKKAIGFEAAMAEVFSILDVNVGRFQGMSREILELARTSGEAPRTLAASLYQLVSAGVDSADATDLLAVATKAAVAGVTDTRTAVDTLTSILNAYGLSADKAMDVSDILFETVKQGKTTFAEIGATIGRVAPIAATMGVSLNDVGASLATLTKGGFSTDEAMTAIRAILISVLKPSAEALKLTKKLGIAFSAEGIAAEGLGGFLQSVAKETESNVDMMAALFPNTRALNAVMALAGSQAKEFAKQLKNMRDTSGATETAFQIIAKTIDFLLRKAWASLSVDLIRIGNKVMPFVLAAGERLSSWLKKTADWVEANSDSISAFFAEMKYWAGDAWMFIEGAITTAMDVIKGGHDTFMDSLQEKARATWDAIVEIWNGVKDILSPIVQGIGDAIRGDWDAAGEKWTEAVSGITKAIFKILEATLPILIELGATMLSSIIAGLRDAKAIEKAKELIELLWSTLQDAGAVQRLKELGVAIGKGIMSGIWQAVKAGAGGITDALFAALKDTPILGTLLKDIAGEFDPDVAGLDQPITGAEADKFRSTQETGGAKTSTAASGTGATSNVTINNLFKQDNSDVERIARDTSRLSARGRI